MADCKTMTLSERGKKASAERWNQLAPRATHTGVLVIGDVELACDVLKDGTRVLRQKTFLKAMGKGALGKWDHEKGKKLNLPVFLTANNLIPYLGSYFEQRGDSIIRYKGINGQKLQGYDATILPEVCKAYAKAHEDKVLQGNQVDIAKACKMILYGLATVGIVALVDDATGYVEQRQRNELQTILSKYISEELRPWTKKFPDEFFKQAFRIHGWKYDELSNSRPSCLGNFINKYIYEKLPEGVLEELKKKNPQDDQKRRKFTHHQFLTPDIGNDNLKKQLIQTISTMKSSDDLSEFKNLTLKLESRN